jgi:hypothetical protein
VVFTVVNTTGAPLGTSDERDRLGQYERAGGYQTRGVIIRAAGGSTRTAGDERYQYTNKIDSQPSLHAILRVGGGHLQPANRRRSARASKGISATSVRPMGSAETRSMFY